MYLFKSGDSFSVVYDESTLPEEYKAKGIKVESLSAGEGILKQKEDGTFYYEPFPDPEIVDEVVDDEKVAMAEAIIDLEARLSALEGGK